MCPKRVRPAGVDCVIFSSYSEAPVFDVIGRRTAVASTSGSACRCRLSAGHQWLPVSSARMGTGSVHTLPTGGPGLVCVDLDRGDPPWTSL